MRGRLRGRSGREGMGVCEEGLDVHFLGRGVGSMGERGNLRR